MRNGGPTWGVGYWVGLAYGIYCKILYRPCCWWGDQSHEMCPQIRVVSESGAGGARLRIFGAGPPAPNLHLGSEILEPAPEFRSPGAAPSKCARKGTQVKSRWSPAPSFCSPAPFFGAETCCAKSAPRLRNLEPAPDFGAQVRLQQGAQTHTTPGDQSNKFNRFH